MLSYEAIIGRLEQIERDLEKKQEPLEKAAEEAHRCERDVELRLAKGRLAAKGDTQTEKKDRALVALAAAEDDLYERWVNADAVYAGLKAVTNVLDKRSMIGMALLKRFQREMGG